MIITGWNTYDGNWNQTMISFVEIMFFTLKLKTQCIGQKKLGFSHYWCDLAQGLHGRFTISIEQAK